MAGEVNRESSANLCVQVSAVSKSKRNRKLGLSILRSGIPLCAVPAAYPQRDGMKLGRYRFMPNLEHLHRHTAYLLANPHYIFIFLTQMKGT